MSKKKKKKEQNVTSIKEHVESCKSNEGQLG